MHDYALKSIVFKHFLKLLLGKLAVDDKAIEPLLVITGYAVDDKQPFPRL